MIRDIRFSKSKKMRTKMGGIMYTYDGPGDSAFLGDPSYWRSLGDSDFLFEDAVATLSHETLHKATWKMDCSDASQGIDNLEESFRGVDAANGLPKWLFHSKRPIGRQLTLGEAP